jgi:hypothetical protein
MADLRGRDLVLQLMSSSHRVRNLVVLLGRGLPRSPMFSRDGWLPLAGMPEAVTTVVIVSVSLVVVTSQTSVTFSVPSSSCDHWPRR